MGVPPVNIGRPNPGPMATPPQVNFMPKPFMPGSGSATPLQFQMSGEFTNVPLNAEPPKKQQKVQTYAREEDSDDSEEERRQQEKLRKQKEEKKRQKEQEEKKKKEAEKKKADKQGASEGSTGITGKVKNLLGSGFGIFKKGKKEVKLGDDNQFYFNKELNMWVERVSLTRVRAPFAKRFS